MDKIVKPRGLVIGYVVQNIYSLYNRRKKKRGKESN